jgi:hypothetical protein
MTPTNFIKKIKRRTWYELVKATRNTRFYYHIYPSYWRYQFSNKSKSRKLDSDIFISSTPNPSAGIGHQLANWNAGLWLAEMLGCPFAHIPFSTERWETFLGFGEQFPSLINLKKKGYKQRKLPLFDDTSEEEIDFVKRIIASYSGQKVVFVTEQDQPYTKQYETIPTLIRLFNSSRNRDSEETVYDPDAFNIAVHIRRAVVIDNQLIEEDEEQRKKRWLDNDYYEKTLASILDNLKAGRRIKIHIFSTSEADEFRSFSKYGDVVFCNHLDEYSSFLHFVRADLLITSKSSFSYKPALLNEGIKVCPRHFWHGYPDSRKWLLADNDGSISEAELKKLP